MKPVIYIMGVSGSGKTTIGELLSHHTGIPFFDADDFHSVANKEKMRAGIPLTDEDRVDWLKALHRLALQQAASSGAIIACSALKAVYRSILEKELAAYWIFLKGDFELIQQRLNKRKGHYMPSSLLQSQFDALEVPADAFTVDIHQAPELITEQIVAYINAG